MEVLTISKIKELYPDEWVLIGNPEMDESEQQVLSGLAAFHSKSKKEVCYLGAELVKTFDTYMLIFTGKPRHLKHIAASVFNRKTK